MSMLAGIDGSVTIDTVVMGVTAWSMASSINLVETTEIGNKAKTYFPTIKDGSGSITFNLKSGEDTQDALLEQFISGNTVSVVALELIYETGESLDCNAYLSSFETSAAPDGIYVISCSFTATGGISAVPSSTTT